MRAIAGNAVRSPASTTQPASSGRLKLPLGSPSPTWSPTQSVWAHSVTRPWSWITTSRLSRPEASDRTV